VATPSLHARRRVPGQFIDGVFHLHKTRASANARIGFARVDPSSFSGKPRYRHASWNQTGRPRWNTIRFHGGQEQLSLGHGTEIASEDAHLTGDWFEQPRGQLEDQRFTGSSLADEYLVSRSRTWKEMPRRISPSLKPR